MTPLRDRCRWVRREPVRSHATAHPLLIAGVCALIRHMPTRAAAQVGAFSAALSLAWFRVVLAAEPEGLPTNTEQSSLGFLELLVLGAMAFVAWRLWRAHRDNSPKGHPGDPTGDARPEAPGENSDETTPEITTRQASKVYQRAAQTWEALGSTPPSPTGTDALSTGPDTTSPGTQPPPPGTADEFLEGAKAVFARVRESFGRGDMDDVAQFTTPECLEWFQGNGPTSSTWTKGSEILLVDARLEAKTSDAGAERAVVADSALIRPGRADSPPVETRETWHFVKNATDPAATWRLASVES